MTRTLWVSGLLALVCTLGCGAASGDSASSRKSTTKSRSATKPSTASAGTSGGAGSASSASDFGNNAMPNTTVRKVDGGVDAGNNGIGGPDQGCGSAEFTPMIKTTMMTTMTTTRTPGNVLLIFDKSQSMTENWSNNTSKWQAATSAITTAITALQNDIAMAGAIFFPFDDASDGCNVDPIGSGKQIDWMPGPQFVSAWTSWIGAHSPGGFTPTNDAASRADAALSSELPMLTGTTAVVFITDGDPTCPLGSTDASVAIQLAGQWLSKYMIKTYVVGLPGTSSNGQMVLSSLASAGGTMTYTSPDDPMALQTLLSQIVSSSVMSNTTTMTTTSFDSCTIMLPKQPPNIDDVTLVVTQMGMSDKQQVPRDLGTGGGWTIDSAGTEIVLQGLFCDFARMGKYDKISVAFGCVDYPPLPPPKVE